MSEEKSKGGRPTKYNQELLDMAYDYLETWSNDGDVIPSHIGLALRLEINQDTLYDWAKQPEKKEFSEILKQCMAKQQRELINKGLDSTFNSAITKLVLGKHGFHEKQDIDHSGEMNITKIVHEIIDPKD